MSEQDYETPPNLTEELRALKRRVNDLERRVTPGVVYQGPGRSLNTVYQPDKNYPILVVASIDLESNGSGTVGALLYIDDVNPPVDIWDTVSLYHADATVTRTTSPLVGIVPAGHYYKIVSSGSPAPVLAYITEYRL